MRHLPGLQFEGERLDQPPKPFVPKDEGQPYPKAAPWPFPGIPTWFEFQQLYGQSIEGRPRLAVIYEQILAMAIYDQMRKKEDV